MCFSHLLKELHKIYIEYVQVLTAYIQRIVFILYESLAMYIMDMWRYGDMYYKNRFLFEIHKEDEIVLNTAQLIER